MGGSTAVYDGETSQQLIQGGKRADKMTVGRGWVVEDVGRGGWGLGGVGRGCGAVRRDAMWCGVGGVGGVGCGAVRCGAVRCSAVWYGVCK